MSSMVVYIILVMVVVYGGFFYFMNLKKQKQKALMQNTDFGAEMNNAETYKSNFLNKELSFLTKQMEGKPIDAFNYANAEYSAKSSIKDGLKDGLRGMATLGTVRFQTVQTPKYLILSGSDLHLLDTDTDGEISNHLIFDSIRLEKSSLTEMPLEGTMKAFAKQKGDNVKAYKISLATDEKPVELIIFSALIFTQVTSVAGSFSFNVKKNLQEIVVANDFLIKLGKKFPNMRVDALLLN